MDNLFEPFEHKSSTPVAEEYIPLFVVPENEYVGFDAEPDGPYV